MAAYSYLGQGSQAFVVRADLNLGQLEASTTVPTAPYATSGGLWLDTDASKFGIHEWSATNNTWENKIPTVEINATGAQAPIDGDTTFTPSTAASAATNDKYLVVVHVCCKQFFFCWCINTIKIRIFNFRASYSHMDLLSTCII